MRSTKEVAMLAQRVVKFETIRALEASLKEKSSAMAAATISAEGTLSREKERLLSC